VKSEKDVRQEEEAKKKKACADALGTANI